MVLNQQAQQLQRYELDLEGFEARYGMDSREFYEQFESGTLGDPMDFFEWASLFELKQAVEKKITGSERA